MWALVTARLTEPDPADEMASSIQVWTGAEQAARFARLIGHRVDATRIQIVRDTPVVIEIGDMPMLPECVT